MNGLQLMPVYDLNSNIWEIWTNILASLGKTQEHSPAQLKNNPKKSTTKPALSQSVIASVVDETPENRSYHVDWRDWTVYLFPIIRCKSSYI